MRITSICTYFVTSLLVTVTSGEKGQRLMLVLLDGFRWDYAEKFNLTNFKRFSLLGARASAMTSDFPTLSLPNYYSIATGLHAETHGITANYMYDVTTNETFILGVNPDHVHHHWWEGGYPIWVTAEQMGRKVYAYYWRGTEVPIHGVRPTHYLPYDGPTTNQQFRDVTTQGLQLLNNKTADFVAIYHERPDKYGHRYGPDSSELAKTLWEIDDMMGDLMDAVGADGNGQQVNLMVVSDHGMTNIDRSRVINISSILTPDLYTDIEEDGAVCTIYLKEPNLQNKVYHMLKDIHPNMTVYRRRDIPEAWHYKHGKYVPRVVCVADPGWFIVQPLNGDFFVDTTTGRDMKGTHGYNKGNSDMRGIFYAMGPYFKAGSLVESIQIVDLYNVMCGILNLTPRPNNGTAQHMTSLLVSSSPLNQPTNCIHTLALISTFVCYYLYNLLS